MGTPANEAPATATTPSPPSGKALKPKPTTLLDVHEVEWITRELEMLLAWENAGAAALQLHDGHHQHHSNRRRTDRLVSPAQDQKPQAKKGGFFLTELVGKHAATICGDEAVTRIVSAGINGRRRRRGRVGFPEVGKS